MKDVKNEHKPWEGGEKVNSRYAVHHNEACQSDDIAENLILLAPVGWAQGANPKDPPSEELTPKHEPNSYIFPFLHFVDNIAFVSP